MKFRKKRMLRTKKTTIVVFLLSLAVMFVTYLVTQSIIMRIELADFTKELQEDTKENLVSAKNLLDGMVADLHNTAEQILKYDNLDIPEVKDVLQFSQKMNSFDATFVADVNGNAYSDTGYTFNVADQEYFHDAMEEGNVVFSEILPSKRFGAIQIIAFPLQSKEQEQKSVLFGLFAVDTFSDLIKAVVDKEKKIYIVDSNGTYISCFNTNHVEADHGNFWDEIESRQLLNVTTAELKEEFRAGKEGDFSFIDHELDMNRYAYHMPLGIQDWQIVLTVKETVVNSHILSIQHVDAIDFVIDAICTTIMLICIYSCFKRINSEIIEVNQEISKNNEMLRMAVEHTNYIIFEYDREKRRVQTKKDIPDFPFTWTTISQSLDDMLATNKISEDSIVALKNLFSMIEHEQGAQTDIQVFNKDHEKMWYRVRMYNLYNEKGDIVGTVGSAEDISILKKGEAAIKRKDELYKGFMANALLYARVNLTTEMVSELNGKEIQIPYRTYLKKLLDEHVSNEHYSYVAQALSIETLREEYQQGKECVEVQCLMKGKEKTKWVSCLVYRVHMRKSAQVTFLIRDIDEKKRQEIALKQQAEQDGLTGLYNAVTTRSKINEVLGKKHDLQGSHVFVLLDLDNFKQINDTFGHIYGDQVLIDVANILKERFRSSDVIGRLGGDEFVIMLFEVRSEKYIERLMRGLKEALTKNYTQEDKTVGISASMGVVLAPNDGITFEELYKKADEALYQVKKQGKNGYRKYR